MNAKKPKKTNSKKPANKMGKGLSSLFQKTDLDDILEQPLKTPSPIADSLATSDSVLEIPVNKIIPNSNQPRNYFDDEKLAELAESIKQVGIIEPIIVVKSGKNYEIIAGERRWRATQKAGISKIPAVVKNELPEQLIEMMLIENIQREDLSPIEEAECYQLILNQRNITQDELSKRIGKSRSHITNLIRTLKLPGLGRKYLTEGIISIGQAKVLLSQEESLSDELIETVVQKKMTVREIENLLKKGKKSSQSIDKSQPPEKIDANLKAIENQFRDKFKTKVTLSDLKNKVGKLEIEYYHYDDLIAWLNKIQD